MYRNVLNKNNKKNQQKYRVIFVYALFCVIYGQ